MRKSSQLQTMRKKQYNAALKELLTHKSKFSTFCKSKILKKDEIDKQGINTDLLKLFESKIPKKKVFSES